MLSFLRSAIRRALLPIVVAVSLLAHGGAVWAAPETPAQARANHDQAKARALGRSVVKLMLKVDEVTTYVGTGVYVEVADKLFLLTANHVVTVDGNLPEGLG